MYNCDDWEEIYIFSNENRKWLRNFLQLTGGIPTAETYENIISIINSQELQEFCMYAYEELIENARKKRRHISLIPNVIIRLNLKGNQGNFYKDIIDYFDEDIFLIIKSGYERGYSLSREKSHSQIITYEYYQTEKVKWYAEYKDWKKLRSIGLIVKTIEG